MKITKNKLKRNNAGFLLVEVLVVAALITVASIAIVVVAQKSLYVSRQALHSTQANFLLEEGAEVVRTIRDNGWSGVSSLTTGSTYYPVFSGGNWSLSGTPTTVGIFSRSVVFGNVVRDDSTGSISGSGTEDPGTKLVTVTVSWTEGGSSVQKTLSFYITDLFSS